MKKSFLKFFLLIIVTLIGCQNQQKKNQNSHSEIEKSELNPAAKIEIELNNDTVYKDEFIKGIIRLKKSSFGNENSKIIVAIEDSLSILKSDLSNERETYLTIFQNLENDTVNKKYFKEYDLSKTVAFGKKMKITGVRKIRGYVMEFYGINLGLEYDITSDSLSNQRNKIYFEKEITVLSN
jgi:hypothetical protein